MSVDIHVLSEEETRRWDQYVLAHPAANVYQLSGWRTVIERSYNQDTSFLVASAGDRITGVCPLVHLRHVLFGNNLYSLPYFDLGGILADDATSGRALLDAAIDIARQRDADTIELRQTAPLDIIADKDGSATYTTMNHAATVQVQTQSDKVRMVMELPESADQLMQSFKSKFRTKIRLPAKKGCTCRAGGNELIDAFYEVFSLNMRDLGSPVHARGLFENVMAVFADRARLFVVDHGDEHLAAGMVIGFRDTLFNPWASSLKGWSNIRPNTYLYWNILENACANGYRYFDFGRSDPGGNTYVFKQQWGARSIPLNWHVFNMKNKAMQQLKRTDKSKFDTAIHWWKKLPVPVANLIGPRIRKHIGL